MNTVIVDDNEKAQNLLEKLLKAYCPDIKLLAKGNNIVEGKKLIEELQPDLVFLDVEMPNGTGFDLLRELENNINFKVIFTTAHEKYALKAIKYSALDYLLKPIDTDDLLEAVAKAKEDIMEEHTQAQINNLLQNLGNHKQKIILKDKYGMQIVPFQDIIRLEAESNYTTFYIQNSKAVVVGKSLKEYEEVLPNEQFFRCHKSHIVNLNYLVRYDKRESEVLILKDDSQVPISRRKTATLLKIIEENFKDL